MSHSDSSAGKSEVNLDALAPEASEERERIYALSDVEPLPHEMAGLSRFERFAFRLAHLMNSGAGKRLQTFLQRQLGARLIQMTQYNLLRVYGIENLRHVSPSRPVLLVANHRSFFDLFIVAAVLYRRTNLCGAMYFPVRAMFFYETWRGILVNMLMGWWSMYPPIMGGDERKRLFDKYAIRRLTALCREGAGHVVGFHPEGKRNMVDDPYQLLKPQPGVGKLIKEARPQVVPVFIAGLGNDVLAQVKENWTNGEKVRVHFGAPIDLTDQVAMDNRLRTYVEIGRLVMQHIAALGEADKLQASKNFPQDKTRVEV